MPNGYMGKILWVSLSDFTISTLNTMDYATDYIGGKGIATRLYWEKAKTRIQDGLDPENLLIFMTGPLSGTISPASARTTIGFKSLTQWPKAWFSTSSFGGEWGPQLKYAGYDGLVLHGKARHPVYLWINDEKVEFRDASKLWGKDTYDTQQAIAEDLGGDKKIKVLTIGPAGENMVRQAILLTDTGNAAGWGPGGVMGSKNVKAIAVRGIKGVKVANPKALMIECQRHLDLSHAQREERIGPSFFIKGSSLEKSFVRNTNCISCPYICHDYIAPKDETFGEAWCAPAIDPAAWVGQTEKGLNPVINDFGDITYLGPPVNDNRSWFFAKIFDLMGINTFNMGGLGHVGSNWPLACYHLGIFTREVTYPIDLSQIGTREFSETFANAVAKREGKFATLIGEGAVRAAAYIREHPEELGLTGEQAEKQWEMCQRVYPAHGMLNHLFYGGLPNSPEFRQAPISAMLWAISTRDPFSGHHAVSMVYENLMHGNARGHARASFFDEEAACRYLDAEGSPVLANERNQPEKGKYYDLENIERKPVRANFVKGTPQAVKYALAYGIQNDSLTLCDSRFPVINGRGSTMGFTGDPDRCTDTAFGSRVYTAVTGIPKTFTQLLEDSWRVWLLDRAINIRDNDRSRDDDTFSEYFFDRPDSEGISIDRDEFEKGKDLFYELMGCDISTGNPSKPTLEKYGLKDVADKLAKQGKLP